jgi:hypothetical protein
MPKDARLVAKIINIWVPGNFLNESASGTGPIYEQKMPSRNSRRSTVRRKRLDAPAPRYRTKAVSKRPNAASKATGGKAPRLHDKLAAKAARG